MISVANIVTDNMEKGNSNNNNNPSLLQTENKNKKQETPKTSSIKTGDLPPLSQIEHNIIKDLPYQIKYELAKEYKKQIALHNKSMESPQILKKLKEAFDTNIIKKIEKKAVIDNIIERNKKKKQNLLKYNNYIKQPILKDKKQKSLHYLIQKPTQLQGFSFVFKIHSFLFYFILFYFIFFCFLFLDFSMRNI